MITKTVNVTVSVNVTVDETKFDDDFMREFSEGIFPVATIDGHIQNLASQAALGMIPARGAFVEGYGPMDEMGIVAVVDGVQTEIEDD